jgi:hypothetical protein
MLAAVACYSTGDGTAPPPLRLYFPVGLAVSQGGSTLYVVNSDFDLQYNAGTVQSYRLTQMRQDAVKLVLDHVLPDDHDVEAGKLPDAACPYTFPNGPVSIPDPNNSTGYYGGPGELPIGQACAPPVRSSLYTDNEVYIGAFATDIQMSITKDRLFIPVRGNASLTWVDVDNDTTDGAAPQTLRCTNSLDSNKQFCTTTAGNDSNEQGNTRVLTLPGEPFGMAQTDDGTAIALTHQNQTETSLLLSGIPLGSPAPVSRSQLGSYPPPPASPRLDPSLQFIVGNMPTGGVGLASIPHDPAATPGIGVRPAFLQTSSAVPEVDLLRYYSDEAYQPYLDAGADVVFQPVPVDDAGVRVGSSNLRPFLQKEAAYSVGVNSSGANSRGIAIDPTPRIVCEQTLLQGDPTITPSDPRYIACAQLPARVFIANRSPPTLILGQIGGFPNGNPSYDPDYFSIYGNVPLTAGPSNVYLAPVVDGSGHYALRVFVVCFDSQVIVVWDPDAQRVENVIRTGPGPFAMAFDPFDLMQVAMHAAVPFDPNSPEPLQGGALDGQPALRSYRFGYIASFTDSFLQVLDLDQSFQDKRLQGVPTFETIVYQVGEPTVPKGSQ